MGKYQKVKIGKYKIHVRPISPKIIFELNKQGISMRDIASLDGWSEKVVKAMIKECIKEKDE